MDTTSSDERNAVPSVDRRSVLGGIAAVGSVAFAPEAGAMIRSATPAVVALPSPNQIKQDYAELVAFGPRLPGNENHVRFVRWLARQFSAAGLKTGPCEEYEYRHWEPRISSLKVHAGGRSTSVRFPTAYVRSAPTGAKGVRGPLVYGGSLAATGPADLGDIPPGAIVVFDGQLPEAPVGKLVDPVFVHDPDGGAADFLGRAYKRLWLTHDYRLDAVVPKNVAGVVIIMDVSSDMIRGNYSPHSSTYRPPLPALFVGSDQGDLLRTAAKTGGQATLTLDAEWRDGVLPQLTAVLPGMSDEVIIVDTHTDGQNFIEENGCIALLHLARHFASLPVAERLRRTVVFACWPGHMTGTEPEAKGWIRAHPDLVGRAAAAITVEHLGATEWVDLPGKGYASTGRNELVNFACTQGPLMQEVIGLLKRFDLKNHVVQAAPGVTTGAAFHEDGIPHVGCIAGPNYLLSVVPNGHIDKLDAALATKQTAMLAELIRFIDGMPAAELRAHDPTLGRAPVTGSDTSRPVDCADAPRPRVRVAKGTARDRRSRAGSVGFSRRPSGSRS